jgi:L-ascorbate metabolism protein UlaG (beta-lactamase superfamily)
LDVTWLGHGCFRLRGRGAVAITDPYPPSLGLKLPKLEGDLVTVSHSHDNHSYVQAVKDARLVDTPGEYEVAGITVTGFAAFHDSVRGEERGRNTVFVIEVDDVRICHLGDLGHRLDDDILDALGTIDVLLAPVGGGTSLDASRAAEVVRQVEPRNVVPMHYALPNIKLQLDPVDRFLREMGVTDVEPQAKLSVQATSGETETPRVVVLDAKLA